MEKKNDLLVVLIVVLSILVGGMGCFIIFDKVINKDDVKETSPETNKPTEEIKVSYIGTYTLTYKASAPENVKGEAVSTLKLNEDKTFEFIANMCSGMGTINGNYSIEGNTIVLKDFKVAEGFQSMFELNLRGSDTLEFAIMADNELYLINTDFGCTLSGNEYGTFIRK